MVAGHRALGKSTFVKDLDNFFSADKSLDGGLTLAGKAQAALGLSPASKTAADKAYVHTDEVEQTTIEMAPDESYQIVFNIHDTPGYVPIHFQSLIVITLSHLQPVCLSSFNFFRPRRSYTN